MRAPTVVFLLLMLADASNPFMGAFFHLGEDQEEGSFVGVARNLKVPVRMSVASTPPRLGDLDSEDRHVADPESLSRELPAARVIRADLPRCHIEQRSRSSDAADTVA